MAQIFLLAFCGYWLTRKAVVAESLLKGMSRLIVDVLLPCFIFVKFVGSFDFSAFPRWWIFPLLSCAVMGAGVAISKLFFAIDRRFKEHQREFISLVAFQNSGYLPLILVALLLSGEAQERMFISIVLFLLGFNLVIWSAGVFFLTKEKDKQKERGTLFNPPVAAILVSLLLIVTGLHRFIPVFVMRSAKMFGDCVLPLAMFVVGGNLALVPMRTRENAHSIAGVVLAKLFIMPLIFFGVIALVRPSYEIAFLLLLQAMAPSATSLSLIIRNYDTQDNIISMGIFWTHLVSMVTIPLFLVLVSLLRHFLS